MYRSHYTTRDTLRKVYTLPHADQTTEPATANTRPNQEARVSRITRGPIRRTVLWLALPVLGEQVLNTIVGLFDTFLAGNLSGDISVSATSAIGLAAYVGWCASLLVMLIGTGTTALVSRHEGAGQHRKANHFANQSVTLAAALGTCLVIFFYLLAPLLASYCRMTGPTYRIAVTYLRVDAIGHLFLALTIVGAAALRGVGNMRTPMLIYAAVNVVNVITSLTLVYGVGPIPSLGVNGIVAGTLTARVTGAALMLITLARGRSGLQLRLRELIVLMKHARRLLRIGLPAAADGAVMWSGHFAFLAIVARLADPPLGEAYFAAHIIAIRVEALTYLPAVAWATAASTMIGQALGAQNPARARQAGHEAAKQCGMLSIAVAIAFFFGARAIYGIMSVDALVCEVGPGPFRVLAMFQPAIVMAIVYFGALRGAGDTRVPLVITMAGVALRLTAGYVFGVVLDGGLLGAWMGMFADMIWRALASLWRFRSGLWQNVKV